MLADIGGMSVIEHTWRNVCKADVSANIIIATDNLAILKHCRGFGADTIMTRVDHDNGTERTIEVIEQEGVPNHEPVINVQGDNWNVNPCAIEEMADNLKSCAPHNKQNTLFALREEFQSDEQRNDPGAVKVICDATSSALMFTRYPIPGAMHHCGIYGYYAAFLRQYENMQHRTLEKAERLEQMRVLENGWFVKCYALTKCESAGWSINTPDDLLRARNMYKPPLAVVRG